MAMIFAASGLAGYFGIELLLFVSGDEGERADVLVKFVERKFRHDLHAPIVGRDDFHVVLISR